MDLNKTPHEDVATIPVLKDMAPSPLRRFLAVGSVTVLLVMCLLADTTTGQTFCRFGQVVREFQMMLRDAATQWMVLACCAVYFVTFTLLERRETTRPFWNWDNPQVWVTALLVFAALQYGLSYRSASGSTFALMLLGGVVLGKGAGFWAGWEAQKFRHLTQSLSPVEAERVSAEPTRHVFIGVLVALLVAAALLKSETGLQFQYRGQGRWTGPWDNPNIFGMLMGVGCVLAVGQVIGRLKAKGQSSKALFEHPTSNFEHPTSNEGPKESEIWRWLKLVFFVTAAVVCGLGLVKSYSRGAWLGVAVGLGYLGWSWWTARTHLTLALKTKHLIRPSATFSPSDAEKGTLGGEGGALSCVSCISWLQRNLVPLSVVLLSLVILAFWNFRHTEQPTARRAFSAANVNDFSWRNRLAAWEGAVQMMASKPFLGFGWNQPERIYDQFYRVPKVTESAAMQMNDYFTLGTTLGIPALFCFVAYVVLSLKGYRVTTAPPSQPTNRSRRRKEAERAANPMRPPRHLGGYNVENHGEVRAASGAESNLGMPATGWKRCPTPEWLRATCRAGAIVLLIGFWFDGGLFKLATGSVFWILLELGRSEPVELLESESVKTLH